MKCIKCDHILPDDSLFCQYCGSEQSTQTESAIDLSHSAPMPNASAPSVIVTQESFDTERIMNAKDPVKALMEEQAKETIRVMEVNRTAQSNDESDPEFGLVPEKPIYTLATDIVEGQRAYLGKLRTVNSEKITWKRLGSTSAEGIHGMIDIYETFLPSGQPYKTLYINMYGARTSAVAPKGFCFAESDNKGTYYPIQESAKKTDSATPAKTAQATSAKANTTLKILLWVIYILAVACICVSVYLNIMLRQQVDSMKAEISELNSTISSQKDTIADQKKTISSQKNTISSQKTTISTLTKKAGYYDDICDELDSGDIGFAANNFKSDQSILIVRKNEKNRKFTLTANWSNGGTVSVDYSSYAAYVEFDSDSWYTSTTMTVVPRSVGVTVVTFTNNVNSDRFKILIIVTD